MYFIELFINEKLIKLLSDSFQIRVYVPSYLKLAVDCLNLDFCLMIS